MKIHNVRLGFATNSSSTHSIIFLDPRKGGVFSSPNVEVHDSPGVEGGDFGWDYWTAASKATKRQYVAIHLFNALRFQVNAEVAEAVVESWVKDYERETPGKSAPLGFVDHQSMYVLPSSWEGKGVDKAFFEEFSSFFLRDDVAILGGNDNDDETHALGEGSFTLPLPQDGGGGTLVARKDEAGGYWTVFDRDSGSKVRFSFADPTVKREVTKASAPELIDIKITDYCPFGCAFCYQGSTHEGKHASKEVLTSLAYTLRSMKVFEVALGGGETTMHPNFVEVLEIFRRYGVVPNFTTRNLAWLRDATVWPKVMEACGSFAFSTEVGEDVRKLASLLTVNGIEHSQVNIQYVMGTGSLYDFEAIVRAAAENYFRITLLGYKQTGRGSSFKPQDYRGWMDVLTKLREEQVYFNLGIDTKLAEESGEALQKAGISTRLYETSEGRFSCYLDAVNMKMGASSFVEDLAMKRFKRFDEAEILLTFATYGRS